MATVGSVASVPTGKTAPHLGHLTFLPAGMGLANFRGAWHWGQAKVLADMGSSSSVVGHLSDDREPIPPIIPAAVAAQTKSGPTGVIFGRGTGFQSCRSQTGSESCP